MTATRTLPWINPRMETQVLDLPGEMVESVDEPRYRVLLYNDEGTPRAYVLYMLEHIFLLSDEIAEHVVETAEEENVAVVVIRPKSEAERLVSVAHARARLDGHPLTFDLEQD